MLAGAGSGKTRVLTRRLAYLIRQGARPDRLIAITFTNKAAREMAERAAQLLGPTAHGMWVHTFHSACARVLRREIGAFGYTPDFSILDSDDQRTLVRELVRALNLNEKQFSAGAILGRISQEKNALRSPDQVEAKAGDPFARAVAQVYRAYQERLRHSNALDFDDLLVLVVRLLESGSAQRPEDLPLGPLGSADIERAREVALRYRGWFEHVLVDEYQDTNQAQYRILKALVAEHGRITAVGDEDQSIYAFRGADQGNILRFEEDFPNAQIVRLEQNYRSSQSILDVSGSLIAHNDRRYPKRLWTDSGPGEAVVLYQAPNAAEEATFAASEIAALVAAGRTFGDFAILYRTHAQSRAIEEALLGRSIPYKVIGGLRFYERKEVKDVISYLRLMVNPRDWQAFRRAVSTPRRGVGDATMQSLEQHLASTGESLDSALAHAREVIGVGRAAESLVTFATMVDDLRAKSEGASVTEVIGAVLEQSGLYRELMSEGTIEANTRVENLQELISVAREHEATVGRGLEGVAAFLENVALVAEADSVPGEGSTGAVILLTLHAAKGLEFPVVFLMGLEEGLFPHSRSLLGTKEIEEERRLCYVGMTRAKERLYLTWAAERSLYGGMPQATMPSRFIREIDRGSVAERRPQARTATANPWRSAPVRRAEPRTVTPLSDRQISSFATGDRVVHRKWGEGVVVSVRGNGQDREVTVDFSGGDRRSLLLLYANLEKVEG